MKLNASCSMVKLKPRITDLRARKLRNREQIVYAIRNQAIIQASLTVYRMYRLLLACTLTRYT